MIKKESAITLKHWERISRFAKSPQITYRRFSLRRLML
ncbi:MAG: hypothetical protein GX331_02475 [Firmicutes bacterium]|nr:hypothetical protein [Bacillota bacterium]